jgi:hypothetical protein
VLDPDNRFSGLLVLDWLSIREWRFMIRRTIGPLILISLLFPPICGAINKVKLARTLLRISQVFLAGAVAADIQSGFVAHSRGFREANPALGGSRASQTAILASFGALQILATEKLASRPGKAGKIIAISANISKGAWHVWAAHHNHSLKQPERRADIK